MTGYRRSTPQRQRALNFQPGTEWRCCNTGYFRCVGVVQRASGQSLAELLASASSFPG
jgi:hypothetical protein